MNDLRPATPAYGQAFRDASEDRGRHRGALLSKAALAAIGAGNGSAPHVLHRPARGPMPIVAERLSVASPEPAKVELVSAASVTMTATRWLWNGYLAQGKMHVLGGAPGCGKTTIVLALIATVTRGDFFPDGSLCRNRGNVVIWSGEDDPADTLAPRLAAAGANMRRVYFVGAVRESGASRSFDPAKDAAALREAIKAAGGASLLMVDPIVSAVAGDSHKNAEVRRALQPLADLAAEVGAALIGITHFSKGTSGRDPTERITGSLAFGALARVVMIAAKVEPKDDEPAKRIFARSKSNIGPDDGGFEYSLEQVEVPDHPGMFASVARWGNAIEGTAREILAEAEAPSDSDGSALGDAKAFLRDFLSEGSKSVSEIQPAARHAGISKITLRRAREDLKIKLSKSGMTGGWEWSLPEGDQEKAKVFTPQSVNTFGKDEHLRDEDGGVDL